MIWRGKRSAGKGEPMEGADKPAGAPEKPPAEPEVLWGVFVASWPWEWFKAGTKAPAPMGRWLESVGGEEAAGGLQRAVKESLKSRCRSAARAGCKARTPGGWRTGDWVWSGGERGWWKAQMGSGRGWGESGCGDRWSACSFETKITRNYITTPKL